MCLSPPTTFTTVADSELATMLTYPMSPGRFRLVRYITQLQLPQSIAIISQPQDRRTAARSIDNY